MRCYLLLILVITCRMVHMSNILAIFPLPLTSHTSNFMVIFKALANRGHNVTVVSPFPQKTPVPNLTDIEVLQDLDDFAGKMPVMDLTETSERFFQLYSFWQIGFNLAEMALSNDAVQKLIRDKNSKFDLILMESFIFQEPLVAFGYKFNAPIINLHPSILPAYAAYYTGNHIPYSYSPTRFSKFSDHMTFLERAETAFFHTWDLLMHSVFLIRQDQLMRKYLEHPGLPNLPPLREMLKNTSLTLINYNSAVSYPFPQQKNVVEFGGINMKSAEKLPEDLQQLMDSAPYGVIYFSFGSFFNISMLPTETQISILSTLGKVKQKVLIKWDRPAINVKLPSNVVFRKWYPQTSILAHPNCKLFITHGGISSLIESIYHAVPLVLVPLFADQKYNAALAERSGIGKIVSWKQFTEEHHLLNAMNAVLNNPSYKENMNEKSSVFKDTPINILDNVIFWIEFVIRHKGAPHLRPAVLDLYWFQDMMLDVLAFYLLIISIFIYVIKVMLRFMSGCLKRLKCNKNNKKNVKKSKKE